MKRTIILIAMIIIALIAVIPVMAQTDPGSGYPIPTEEPVPFPVGSGYPIETPHPMCCYDELGFWGFDESTCDEYYDLYPNKLCEDCPERCKDKLVPEPLVIVWFRRFVKWATSVFE